MKWHSVNHGRREVERGGGGRRSHMHFKQHERHEPCTESKPRKIDPGACKSQAEKYLMTYVIITSSNHIIFSEHFASKR